MMANIWSVLLLLVFGLFFHQAASQCQISILGNDAPLIAGIQKDVTCVYNCQDVASIGWFLVVGSFVVQIKSSNSATELVLDLTPTSDDNGSMFKCTVTDIIGRTYEETITITVRELEHTLNVTASQENPVLAGSRLTLTCLAVASRPVHLQWENSDGDIMNSTSSITVSSPTVNGLSTTITITFDPIKTSDTHNYTCRCEMDNPVSVANTSYYVAVQIPAPIIRVLSNPSSSLRTGDPLRVLCCASVPPHVDTPTEVDIAWINGTSITDNSRVTVTQNTTYESSISISSLRSSDTGTYECCVQVVSPQNLGIDNSDITCSSIEISAVLSVDIIIDYEAPCDYGYSPPYYRPCTPISLTCEVYGASGRIAYRWIASQSSFMSGSTNKTVSTNMLTYADSGLPKCCVEDQAGNSGCAKKEIFIKGHGLYVDDSRYISGVAVSNNTLVVPKATSCTNCKLDVYCCTDRSATLEFVFPNGVRKTTATDYLNMNVEQTNGASRIRLFNHLSLNPLTYGLFWCCVVGSHAQISSLAVYSTLPGPPRVYSSGFQYNSNDSELDYVIRVTCSTSDSPATKVKWYRNEKPIEVNGVDYTTEQRVTDRKNLYYDNVLYVKNSCLAAGTHRFECNISNSQGSDSHTVETNVPVYNETEITTEGSEYAGDKLVLTCSVTLPKTLKDLLPYLRMVWVGPANLALTNDNSVYISGVMYSECGLSRNLTLDRLKSGHSGLYRCQISINKTELAEFFTRILRHSIAVITRSLFQLQFGPVTDCCSCWITRPDVLSTLETNLTTAIVDAINQRCHCDFNEGLIDMGEVSCLLNSVVYRARLTATVYTAEQILAMVQDWVNNQGTFLFTLHGRMRLRLNPDCLPIAITSFSDPECGLSVADINSKLFSAVAV